MSLNAVSKHIRLLERADLVRRRKQGREHLLSFNPEPLTRAEQWIAERKAIWERRLDALGDFLAATTPEDEGKTRSEEHTSELQSLMRNSYAVLCLKKKNTNTDS